MLNKWFIMVAGMGTVFVALILIIAMLYLFRLIFATRPTIKRTGPAPLPEVSSPLHMPSAPGGTAAASSCADMASGAPSGQLVAVIAAAISASAGLAPSSFRIASIAPSSSDEIGFNTPVWGRVERL